MHEGERSEWAAVAPEIDWDSDLRTRPPAEFEVGRALWALRQTSC